ncbi:MAG: helix-turn-helix domain-containing protein [Bacilli bacterium]|nr:helix-turn-helix domain-containing protein [Bacilli bacterium]
MDQTKIGKFIFECRKNKNLTQEDLAEKLGVSSKSISRWENGNTMPDYSLLKDLCDELDINVNELLSGEKIKESDYMIKAEENFINLKKKVDRTIKLLDITSTIIFIIMVGLFIAHMYFNWLYKGPWDDTKIKNVTSILFYISTVCTVITSMLRYEVKK